MRQGGGRVGRRLHHPQPQPAAWGQRGGAGRGVRDRWAPGATAAVEKREAREANVGVGGCHSYSSDVQEELLGARERRRDLGQTSGRT